ncbi:MAG: DnaJ domain-containing protein [Bacteroidota bacterium]
MDLSSFESWLERGTGRIKESPIGKLFESALGSVFEKLKYAPGIDINDSLKRNEFEVSLIVLSAAVIRAEGGASPYELDYVRSFLLKNFDPKFIEARMYLLEQVIAKDFPLRPVCLQIKKLKSHAVRLQLIHYLFGIADADLEITPKEIEVIQHIAKHLGISDKDFRSIRAMFYSGAHLGSKPSSVVISTYYEILEVKTEDSNDDIKKSYRRLVKKYHPDKVQHLGEDVQKAASDKFQKLQEAYDFIKKERGIL